MVKKQVQEYEVTREEPEEETQQEAVERSIWRKYRPTGHQAIASLLLVILSCVVALLVFAYTGNRAPNEIPYKQTVIDGCEYFIYPLQNGYYGVTHKGNCHNRMHPYLVSPSVGE